MTEPIMNDKYGLIKATTMRASGLVPHRPCPYSKEDDFEHKEWGCPEETQEWEESDAHDITHGNTGNADAGDSELLTKLWKGAACTVGEREDKTPEREGASGASPSSSSGRAIDVWNEKVKNFMETRRVTHQRYVIMSLENKGDHNQDGDRRQQVCEGDLS